MRNFRIVGKIDGSFDLNNSNYFLYSPKNLGIKIANTYLKVFNIRIKTEEDIAFRDITGELRIKDYSYYETFRKFLAKNRESGFYLYYSDGINTEKFIECDFTVIDKTELDTFGNLSCNITITPRTYWQQLTTTVTQAVAASDAGGKEYVLIDGETDPLFAYAYTYGLQAGETDPLFAYAYTYGLSNEGIADVTNEGDFEIPVKITIESEAVNPLIQLFDTIGTKISDAKINVTIASGEKLIINSSPDNLQIILISSNGVETDKTTSQDFEKVNYLTLPVGNNTMAFTDDNDNIISAKIERLNTYLGV